MISESLIRLNDSEHLELGAFTLSKTGLAIRGEPSYDEWERCGAFLSQIDGTVQWWVGDWLNAGEDRYGELAAQAIDARHWREETVRVYRWVCKQIPPVSRLTNVSFQLHQEVAALPEAERDAWLIRCADECLTREQLRHQIKTAKAEASESTAEFWLLVKCLDADDQVTLHDRMIVEGRAAKMRISK